MKLGVGERIGVWEIQEALGRGGMGTVYRCHHVETPRIQAAVKVLGAGLHNPSEAQVRFIREAEILAALDHPHIVGVRGLRMDVDPPFIEMDYVDGTPLDRVVKDGPVEVDRALSWMTQLASALTYLHERGVKHRDVKPGNVLVTEGDHVVLVDFGLATDADLEKITQEGLSFGTVSYAPPEWMDPDRLDAVQWDLYAVGVIFYELLSGAVAYPLSGEGPVRKQLLQVALAKQKAPPLDPGEEYPETVRAVIRRATERKAVDRFQTARELLEALEGARRGEMVKEEHHGPAWLPWVIGAAVLAAVVGGALGWMTRPQEVPVETQPVRLDPEVAPPETGSMVVTGPDGARVRAAGMAATLVEREARLEGVPAGEHELHWVIGGEACDACFDGTCPTSCGHGRREVVVGAGGAVDVALPGVPRVPVSVRAPEVARGYGVFKKKEWPLRVTLGSRVLEVTGPGAAAGEVAPGVYQLVVDVGSCMPEEQGCLPGGCPPRCSSHQERVTVPWSGEVDLVLDMPPPEK